MNATKELGYVETIAQCKATVDAITGTFFSVIQPYPVPENSMPKVETTPVRGRPSGVEGCVAPQVHKSDKAPRVPNAPRTGALSESDMIAPGAQPATRIAGASQEMHGRPLAGPEA